jgi:hypothetical protein
MESGESAFVSEVLGWIAKLLPGADELGAQERPLQDRVADKVGRSKKSMQELLKKEGTTFRQLAANFVALDSMVRVDKALDDWVEAGGQGGGKPICVKKIGFAYKNADECFARGTGLTLKEFLEARMAEKLEKASESHGKLRILKAPEAYARMISRRFFLRPGLKKKGAEKISEINVNIEDKDLVEYGKSLLDTLARRIAKKAMEAVAEADDNGYTKRLVKEAATHTLGAWREDVWNAEIGFVKSFAEWARDRKLVRTFVWFDEEEEWKRKFWEFDMKVIEKHNQLCEWYKASDESESDRNTIFVMEVSKLNVRGYLSADSNPLPDDPHPWNAEKKGEKRGISNGKYHDGEGNAYGRMEGETKEEFDEWVEVTFDME